MDEVRIIIEDDNSQNNETTKIDSIEDLLEDRLSPLPAFRTIASPRLEAGYSQADDDFSTTFASSSTDYATVVLLPSDDDSGLDSKVVDDEAVKKPLDDADEKQDETTPLDDIIAQITTTLWRDNQVQVHYYVKIGVSAILSALLLIIGVPVFMESRVTGSISYTALGIVLVGFGLILAIAVIVLLFRPPFKGK